MNPNTPIAELKNDGYKSILNFEVLENISCILRLAIFVGKILCQYSSIDGCWYQINTKSAGCISKGSKLAMSLVVFHWFAKGKTYKIAVENYN